MRIPRIFLLSPARNHNHSNFFALWHARDNLQLGVLVAKDRFSPLEQSAQILKSIVDPPQGWTFVRNFPLFRAAAAATAEEDLEVEDETTVAPQIIVLDLPTAVMAIATKDVAMGTIEVAMGTTGTVEVDRTTMAIVVALVLVIGIATITMVLRMLDDVNTLRIATAWAICETLDIVFQQEFRRLLLLMKRNAKPSTWF